MEEVANNSLGLQDGGSNAVEALFARAGVPLATSNINPLSAKKSGVYRPCARSEHYQTYSKRRKREVHFRSACLSDGKPDLYDCQ